MPPKPRQMRLTAELVARVPPHSGDTGNPARWLPVRTDQGPLRALAFPISRQSDAYLPGLTTETVVKALAAAAGERGSMAEYLHSTLTHLEQRGIHDRYLWKMQDLVADWLENPPDPGVEIAAAP